MIYKKIISDNTLSSLNSLIGSDIQSIYSNGLSVYKDCVESQLFILEINNNSWLNITAQAFETPEDNDYHELIITENAFPEGIVYDKAHNAVVLACSKINLESSKLTSIDIYSRHEVYGEEEFFYDVVLLFHCKNKIKFMISLTERFDEFLIYSSKLKVINRYINGLAVRIAL